MPVPLRPVSRLLCAALLASSATTLAGPSSAAPTILPASSSAGWTLLCTGYTSCAEAGMPHAGYRGARRSMWWRMYAGHNCTNYVAYRMVRSGLPNERPWSGEGNATNWGVARKDLTNGTPAVGAVAWWRAGKRPAGSSGHVAYVEQVLSPDEVVVSQDSWGGDFSWARVTRGGGYWPNGFVHLNDARLRSTRPPRLQGTARVGSRLSVTTGRWAPSGLTLRYRWRADGAVVPHATRRTLRLGPAQRGKRVTARVTASKLGYRAVTVASRRTAPVAPGEFTVAAAPRVRGAARVGSTLRVSRGRWSPGAASVRYRWSAGGHRVRGATRAALRVHPGLLGARVTATVIARRSGYRATATSSSPTARVRPGILRATRGPTVTGVPRPGQLLRLHPGRFSPRPGSVTWSWWRGRVRVSGAPHPRYRLGSADVGHRVTVVVHAARRGYASVRTSTRPTARVRAVPRVTLTARTSGGRVRLTARVRAAAVREVTGTVRVTWRGRTLVLRRLHDGAAGATVRGLPAGTLRLTVRYSGSPQVTGRLVRRAVRVR